MIEFQNVSKRFGEKVILNGVTLKAEPGQILFVVGTSGAGKSVLLKHIVGFLRPDSGRVFVDGQDVTDLSESDFYPVRKKCALVLQHATLFDGMSCVDNVALPLIKHSRLDPARAREQALGFLEEVHLREAADEMPDQLGDGLRKRVAVARALTLEPKYILFDEPTTSLDPVSARRVDELIADLAKSRGVGCIVVSHDLRSIFGIAEKVAMLYRGQVRALGAPRELAEMDDEIVKQFLSGRAHGPMETT